MEESNKTVNATENVADKNVENKEIGKEESVNNSFKPITSQEELNEIIGKRLNRKEEKTRKKVESEFSEKYADYEDLKTELDNLKQTLSDYKEQKAQNESDSTKIKELEDQVKNYEINSIKTRVALEYGLPIELINRISGETEEDITEDVKVLSKFTRNAQNNIVTPTKDVESQSDYDGVSEAFRKLNPRLFK